MTSSPESPAPAAAGALVYVKSIPEPLVIIAAGIVGLLLTALGGA